MISPVDQRTEEEGGKEGGWRGKEGRCPLLIAQTSQAWALYTTESLKPKEAKVEPETAHPLPRPRQTPKPKDKK
eukprot:3118812-Pyramimonas_sp.AAC.1